MVTNERATWIRENLIYGDVSVIASRLAMDYSAVYDIIHRRTPNDRQEKVWDEAEHLVMRRIEQQKRDAKKYKLTK